MANYATLKAAIQQVVKTNGNNEITGSLLQQSLLAMIGSLGANYSYAGLATLTTNPGTPDQNVFYIAEQVGIYANFNSISVATGEIAILKWNGSWVKDSLQIGETIMDASPDLYGRASVPGYINTNGDISDPQSGWYSSDFIPVKPGMTYAGHLYMAVGNPYVTFYSETKRLLSNVLASVTGYEDKTGTVPDGAAYLRFSTFGSLAKKYSFKITDYVTIFSDEIGIVERKADEIFSFELKKDKAIFVGFLQSDGTVYNNNYWGTTDYLPVYGIKSVVINLENASSQVYLCFYDESKTFISGNNTYKINVPVFRDVPDGAVYMRASFAMSSDTQYIRGLTRTFREITNHNHNILSKYVLGQRIYSSELWNVALERGFISDSAGTIYPNDDFRVSEFIPISAGIHVFHLFNSSTKQLYIGFYDRNKNLISATNNFASWLDAEIEAPQGVAYLRISIENSSISNAYFYKKSGSGIENLLEFSAGTTDDAILSQRTTNTQYVWFQVQPKLSHVDKIRFRANTGTTNFYKVDTRTTPATITLLQSVTTVSADDNSVKEFNVDVDLETGVFIGFNGTIRYASSSGVGYVGGYCNADGRDMYLSVNGFVCGFECVSFIKSLIEDLLPQGQKQIYKLDASGNGDFTNIYDALKYTLGLDTAQNPITILVYPGTYVTPALPPSEFSKYCSNRYISIIGIDKVNCVLRNDEGYYNASGSDPNNLGDNSVIKISGNVYIANLTLVATDDNNEDNPDDVYHRSYCIHADAPAPENSIMEIHNCNLINDHAPCIGFGIPKKCTLKITDCELRSDFFMPEFTYGGAIIYGHDRGGSETVVEEHLIVKGCTLISSNGNAIKTINNQNQLMDCIFVNNACALPVGKGIVLGSLTTVIPPSFGNSIEEMNA